jgi:hypothetical protein
MKTYSEENYAHPFDWKEALSKPFSDIDWPELEAKSGKWVTCACGNQCATLPRDNDGTPKDLILRNLGVDFDRAVTFRSESEALNILEQIEERSHFLLIKKPKTTK